MDFCHDNGKILIPWCLSQSQTSEPHMVWSYPKFEKKLGSMAT